MTGTPQAWQGVGGFSSMNRCRLNSAQKAGGTIYYPSRRHLPPGLRRLIEMVRAKGCSWRFSFATRAATGS